MDFRRTKQGVEFKFQRLVLFMPVLLNYHFSLAKASLIQLNAFTRFSSDVA